MYEELINTLRRFGLTNGTSLGRHMGLMDEAADAIAALHAENAEKDKCIAHVEAERDAAMAAMKIVAGGRCCQICSRDCLGHEDISVCTAS